MEGKLLWNVNVKIKEKQKYSNKKLNKCQFIKHKSHIDWSGSELRLLQWKASEKLPEPWNNNVQHKCIMASGDTNQSEQHLYKQPS